MTSNVRRDALPVFKTAGAIVLRYTQIRNEVIASIGSTNRTLTIARRFASEGATLVTQRNKGATAARKDAFSVRLKTRVDPRTPGPAPGEACASPEAEDRVVVGESPGRGVGPRPQHDGFKPCL